MELQDLFWIIAQAELLCAEEVPFRISGGKILAKTTSYKRKGFSSTSKN